MEGRMPDLFVYLFFFFEISAVVGRMIDECVHLLHASSACIHCACRECMQQVLKIWGYLFVLLCQGKVVSVYHWKCILSLLHITSTYPNINLQIIHSLLHLKSNFIFDLSCFSVVSHPLPFWQNTILKEKIQ